jgi:hypothetical protein
MKKVLFITEDGYEITEKDKYFSVKVKEYPQHPLFKNKKPSPLYSIVGPYRNPKATEQSGDILYFYKRENAEKFVSEMKKINIEDIYKQGYLVMSNISSIKIRTNISNEDHETLSNSFITLQGMFNDYIQQLEDKLEKAEASGFTDDSKEDILNQSKTLLK